MRSTAATRFKKVGRVDPRKQTEWHKAYPNRTDEQWRDMYHCYYPYLFDHGDKLSLYPRINPNPRTWQPDQLQTTYDGIREDRYDAFLRIRKKFPELYQDTWQWSKPELDSERPQSEEAKAEMEDWRDPPTFGEFNQFYSVRVGMIGCRVKYTREFDQYGNSMILSMVWIPDNQIIGHKTDEKDGRDAMVVGAMNVASEFHHPRVARKFKVAGVPVKHVTKEFRITPDAFVPIGTKLDVRHFKVGQECTLSMQTFDYGFQGVVKRFGHDGSMMWAGHSRWHRRPGSIGAQGQHRVYPGTAMPGVKGGDRRFFYNKPIYRIDYKHSLVYFVGRLPCDVGAYMTIEDGTFTKGLTMWSANRGYPAFPTFVSSKEDQDYLHTRSTEECQLVSPPLLGYLKDEGKPQTQITQTDVDDARQVKQTVAPPKVEIFDRKKARETEKRARKEFKKMKLERRSREGYYDMVKEKQKEFLQRKAERHARV
ncbi:ribosomal protein L3-like protein [Perkinsela sp. CCAP 1560/4]|nr:ribosomal protein L3-like protein [Perkinsela sp. CCAP 1560/4]|eukprot:KNH05755.1 ribosomal protein L3-like protein [Perkinsela sp. CCAP 1560/4]